MTPNQEILRIPESLFSPSTIKVVPVKEDDYVTRMFTWSGYEQVYTGLSRYVSRPMDSILVNAGASVCLIAWVFDLEESQCLSGHFLLTDVEGYLEKRQEDENFVTALQKRVGLINSPETHDSGFAYYEDPDIVVYLSFLEKVRLMAHSRDSKALEVHLFGQNFQPNRTKPSINVLDNLIQKQNEVQRHMAGCGVGQTQIYDHRLLTGSGSDTLYYPRNRSLLWWQTD